MFVQTKDLPQTVQNLLKTLCFNKRDISLEARETVSPSQGSSQGERAYFATVNLSTGETHVKDGSWGGSNMFTQNQVDSDTNSYLIPQGIIVLKGNTGYQPHCRAYAHPNTLAPLLPAPAPALDPTLLKILRAMKTLKGGAYRNEEFQRIGATETHFETLQTLGFIKVSSNGSKTITTAGKNALTP